MIRQVWKHWRRMADELAEPTKPRRIGFRNPWRYALEVGYWFVMTKGAVLPEPGGLNAQSEAVIHDLKMYLHGLNYARWQAQGDKPSAAHSEDLPEDMMAADWKAFA